MTFKSGKGSDIAQKLLETKNSSGEYPKLFGDTVKCRRADNPSDIRWANKQVRFKQLLLRNLLFALVVLTVLYFTYGWLFFPKLKKSQAEVDILPTIEDCDSMAGQFRSSVTSFADFAKSDYDLLIKAYGDREWNLADQDKKEMTK